MAEVLLVDKRAAAGSLGVSLRTIENLIASKELQVRRIGRRTLIPRVALERFAQKDHPTQKEVEGEAQ